MKRFSKTFSLTILVVFMAFALVGCKTTAAEVGEPVEVVVEAPVAEAPAPVAEAPAPAAEEPAPVVEAPAPVEEVAAVEAPAAEEVGALVIDLSYAGFTASVEVYDGVAFITYPSFVTSDEMIAAATAAYAAYGPYLQGTDLVITAPGQATLTFPQGYTLEDFDFAKEILSKEVAWYLDSLFAAPAVAEPVEEAVVAEVEAVEEVAEPIVRTLDVLGYQATICYADGCVVVDYPDFITNDEVAQAAKTAYAAYGAYLQGTTLVIDNGVAYLTFAEGVELTDADVDFAVAALAQELPAYATAVYAAAQAPAVAEPVVETVVETVVAAVEEVVEEVKEEVAAVVEEVVAAVTAPVVEAPAAAPAAAPASTPASTPAAAPASTPAATTTPAPAPAATTPAPAAAAPAAAKKGNGGLIAVIIVLVVAACAAACIILKKKQK